MNYCSVSNNPEDYYWKNRLKRATYQLGSSLRYLFWTITHPKVEYVPYTPTESSWEIVYRDETESDDMWEHNLTDAITYTYTDTGEEE